MIETEVQQILNTVDDGSVFQVQTFRPTDLFVLSGPSHEVFRIKTNGSFVVNPALTPDQASKEFFNFIQNNTNIIQLAVNEAKLSEREKCVQEVEDRGRQWGIMRSLKTTYFAEAAQKLADLLRK